jgi:1-acyl-sn-glycerol-3-phosphate acyltransferase
LIRALVAATFWIVYLVLGSLIAIPHALITGKIDFLWAVAMWGAKTGARVAGVKLETVGREQLDTAQTYIFMSNHTSNLDPPIEVPAVGRQVSIMAKKELFKIPIFSTAMRIGKVVPVDRHNRESAIESVRHAVEVLQSGVGMFVYPEGTRSRDGRLLPFKKGPFHMAMEANVPVAPITILNTHELWPKGKFEIKPGTVKMIFHAPIHPSQYATREDLLNAVRRQIASAMPEADR